MSRILGVLGLALCAACGSVAPQPVDSPMTGVWSGRAAIFVNWTRQRELSVSLTIERDGRVTGTVGDATLRNAVFRANRGAIGRALHVKTDWIIRGDLDGLIVAADSVRRERVSIPLDWTDGNFHGAVHAGAWMFGGKEHMMLTAGRLVLRRVGPAGGAPGESQPRGFAGAF